jgi:hypothetical protein
MEKEVARAPEPVWALWKRKIPWTQSQIESRIVQTIA